LKGFLVLCSTIMMIALAWVTLSYLEDRDREQEQRFIGALNFTEEVIKTALGPHADIYESSITPGSKSSYWAFSGIVISKDNLGTTSGAQFIAVLESVCSESADPSCWRVDELAIDGQAALSKQDLNAALEQPARFESQAQAAKAESASLSGELAEVRHPSVAPEAADVEAEATRQELVLTAQTAAAHAAMLERDLQAAQQRIADLKADAGDAKAEAASLAEELAEIRKAYTAVLETVRAEAEATR
jgi:hypothetical protein